MGVEFLDRWVPFIMFAYGILLFFVLDVWTLPERLMSQYGHLYQQLLLHKGVSRLCLFVGGLWTLQNIFISF